jgi:hypothetical protein
MSKHNRERRRRAADALPPVNRVPHNLDGKHFSIVEYGVASWCPERDGKVPAEAVAFHITIGFGDGDQLKAVMRLKTPRAVDELVAALERHRNDVWPAG